MNKIGMVGLGAMGHSIAQNILNHGYNMVLYDIRPEALTDLVKQGAEAAKNLLELGEKADVVLMIVNTYQNCCDVLNDLLKTFHDGIIINMSTIAMDEAQNLEKLAAGKNCCMMDCPVSGGTAGAKKGELTIMAAGSPDLFNMYKPLLESFGTNVIHVGLKVGEGQAIKAVNQLLVGIHMCATAEAFNLARQCGLNLQMVYDVINKSAGRSEIFRNRGQFLIDRDFTTRSTLQIQLKDTNIACKTAKLSGAPLMLGTVAQSLFEQAVSKYPVLDDSIEVVRIYEELCDIEVD
ncbi:MAG: NAD(P)-dependent oxidoreductase [Lachnospiraceae bacterium]|nr:NAD(P)-dependent oxidoreductase [Lachnospiraceae bacterium]